MASIYRNSLITLAATGSAGCHEGLFHLYWRRESLALTVFTHEGLQCEVLVRPRIKHWRDTHTNDVSYVFHTLFPLLRRAWAYQERLLAPRVLHFGKDESVWECIRILLVNVATSLPW